MIVIEIHLKKLDKTFNALVEEGYLIAIRVEDIAGNEIMALTPKERRMNKIEILSKKEYKEKIEFSAELFEKNGVYRLVVHTTFQDVESAKILYQIEPIEIGII